MISKNLRLPIFAQHRDFLEQMEAEMTIGWANVSSLLTEKQLILKELVELVHAENLDAEYERSQS